MIPTKSSVCVVFALCMVMGCESEKKEGVSAPEAAPESAPKALEAIEGKAGCAGPEGAWCSVGAWARASRAPLPTGRSILGIGARVRGGEVEFVDDRVWALGAREDAAGLRELKGLGPLTRKGLAKQAMEALGGSRAEITMEGPQVAQALDGVLALAKHPPVELERGWRVGGMEVRRVAPNQWLARGAAANGVETWVLFVDAPAVRPKAAPKASKVPVDLLWARYGCDAPEGVKARACGVLTEGFRSEAAEPGESKGRWVGWLVRPAGDETSAVVMGDGEGGATWMREVAGGLGEGFEPSVQGKEGALRGSIRESLAQKTPAKGVGVRAGDQVELAGIFSGRQGSYTTYVRELGSRRWVIVRSQKTGSVWLGSFERVERVDGW